MRSIENFNPDRNASHAAAASPLLRLLPAVSIAALGLMLASCSSPSKGSGSFPPPNPQGSSVLYFAPSMANNNAATFAIDHTARTFDRKIYSADGGTISDSGDIAVLSNGIVSLESTYNVSSTGVVTIYNPPLTGSWAVEIPGEGALVGMQDYVDFTPVAATGTCPSLKPAKVIQFVTIPRPLTSDPTIIGSGSWNPQMETAFGSVSVLTGGTSVQLNQIKQFKLPVDGQTSAPSNPGPSSASVLCSPTFYGQTIGVPSAVTVINPGTVESVPPNASIGIGPTGFLVEDAGTSQIQGEPYENILGAGFGAIGIPQPSSALDTGSFASARYQGFLFGSGGPANGAPSGAGFSLIASFGYSDLQSSCATLPAPKTGTILYGGEFAGNDPSKHAFGNCDLAVDLGKQDGSSNGLYLAATVYVTAGFPMNTTGKAYSFPAVAIAGQVSGKNAIFLIGADTQGAPQQAWGIYLLQSS